MSESIQEHKWLGRYCGECGVWRGFGNPGPCPGKPEGAVEAERVQTLNESLFLRAQALIENGDWEGLAELASEQVKQRAADAAAKAREDRQ